MHARTFPPTQCARTHPHPPHARTHTQTNTVTETHRHKQTDRRTEERTGRQTDHQTHTRTHYTQMDTPQRNVRCEEPHDPKMPAPDLSTQPSTTPGGCGALYFTGAGSDCKRTPTSSQKAGEAK